MTTIVYLIGRAGSGKYTIAKQLAAHGFKIVDNHLINNPIFSLLNLGKGSSIPNLAWEAIAQIRTVVLDFIGKESKNNYVLTNELLENEEDYKYFRQVEEMAAIRGSLLVPVRLHLSKAENKRRIQVPERALRFKSIQIDESAYEKPLIQLTHPNLMDIDIEHLSAEAVAQKIMKSIRELSKTLL